MFKIDSALESAKDIQGGFKNIPRSPRLPLGVPVGPYVVEVAVQLQM
jgi:hypothetical protein